MIRLFFKSTSFRRRLAEVSPLPIKIPPVEVDILSRFGLRPSNKAQVKALFQRQYRGSQAVLFTKPYCVGAYRQMFVKEDEAYRRNNRYYDVHSNLLQYGASIFVFDKRYPLRHYSIIYVDAPRDLRLLEIETVRLMGDPESKPKPLSDFADIDPSLVENQLKEGLVQNRSYFAHGWIQTELHHIMCKGTHLMDMASSGEIYFHPRPELLAEILPK